MDHISSVSLDNRCCKFDTARGFFKIHFNVFEGLLFFLRHRVLLNSLFP